MKAKNIHNKGLTLLELVVASTLIGIVMVGVSGFGYAVNRMQDISSKSSLIAMDATASLSMMRKDALLAVGDPTNSGIRTIVEPPDKYTICFRHDTNDPTSYADDTWVCYRHGSSNGLWRCTDVDEAEVPATDCPWGGSTISPFYLELKESALFNVPGGCGTCAPGTTNSIDYVEMAISVAPDNAEACHPITNPCVTIDMQINPPGHTK